MNLGMLSTLLSLVVAAVLSLFCVWMPYSVCVLLVFLFLMAIQTLYYFKAQDVTGIDYKSS